MNRTVSVLVRCLAAIALALGCVASMPAASNAVAYAQIEGTGSTWSELIVQQWIADVDANGIKVVYTGGGSSKGRKDFAQGSNDFAISEIPYQGTDELGNADKSDRPYAYLPIVAGGTAFTYQLKVGNDLVRNLRLSGETLVKIFTNQITNWNDPQISKDNNGRKFPSLPITPVVRSDGSGTTAQLTTWMNNQYPSLWRSYFGRSGLTSYYPIKNGTRTIGQSGSDQVMNAVSAASGNGYIGYVEYSYPVNKNFPVVKVLNKAGYYVEPTQYNTAVALTKAKIDPKSLTQILTGVYTNPDKRAYPISSYSYMIIPTAANDPRMTTAKRQTLADFLYYSLCTGQTKAGNYGYSPLTLNLVQAGLKQIALLKKADPKVNLSNRDVRGCNNPTFDGKNPNRNKLAEIAPQPPACDKQGAGPCGFATGTNDPTGGSGGAGGGTTTAGGGGAKAGGGTTGGTTAGGPGATGGAAGGAAGGTGTTAGAAGGAPGAIDPVTGEAITNASAQTGGGDVFADPSTVLSADRPGDKKAFGWLSGLLLVGLVLIPGVYVASLRRRLLAAAR
ncbi:substrate-binding domain-containing protein [Nocardioides sp. TRM66260-LWL]|uniref:substrate-binding domain-containing protein n=1 Tax=Nocardioides sp. TRM66260-LWL TaxID=2874478 RepID=UPI001CC7F343|nr:substrate-binding domain-containing protein [Nocardioides sp. TRM66260-LWL]MBZ5734388.1 substrate-binding domain-containing protein [Nocardioides sp. TRM66260-LWL]